jgi:hypothetical protein
MLILVGFVLFDLEFSVHVVCLSVLFLLVIALSVLFRFTASDYHFGIFKLFLLVYKFDANPFY